MNQKEACFALDAAMTKNYPVTVKLKEGVIYAGTPHAVSEERVWTIHRINTEQATFKEADVDDVTIM